MNARNKMAIVGFVLGMGLSFAAENAACSFTSFRFAKNAIASVIAALILGGVTRGLSAAFYSLGSECDKEPKSSNAQISESVGQSVKIGCHLASALVMGAICHVFEPNFSGDKETSYLDTLVRAAFIISAGTALLGMALQKGASFLSKRGLFCQPDEVAADAYHRLHQVAVDKEFVVPSNVSIQNGV